MSEFTSESHPVGAERGKPLGLALELYPAGGVHPKVIVHGQDMAITLMGEMKPEGIEMTVAATGHDNPESVAKVLMATARLLMSDDYKAHFEQEAAAKNWGGRN